MGSGSGFNAAQNAEFFDLFEETQCIDENAQGIQHSLDTQERAQRYMDKAEEEEANMASLVG